MRNIIRSVVILALVVVMFSLMPIQSRANANPVITVTVSPSTQVVFQQGYTVVVSVTDSSGNPLTGTITMYSTGGTSGGVFGPLALSGTYQLVNGKFTINNTALFSPSSCFFGFNYDVPPAGYNAVDTYTSFMTVTTGMPNSATVLTVPANTTTQVSSTSQAPAGVDVSFGVQVTPVAPSYNILGYGSCIPSPSGAGVSVTIDGTPEGTIGLNCSNTDLSGVGSFDYVFDTVGTHTVTFTFNGTIDFNTSSVTKTITITQPRHR